MEILVAIIWHLSLFFQENSRIVSRIMQQPFPFLSVSSKAYCFIRNVLLVCKITYKYYRDVTDNKKLFWWPTVFTVMHSIVQHKSKDTNCPFLMFYTKIPMTGFFSSFTTEFAGQSLSQVVTTSACTYPSHQHAAALQLAFQHSSICHTPQHASQMFPHLWIRKQKLHLSINA